MTLADSLKTTVFNARGIAGTLGFRPYTIALCTEIYIGADATGPQLTPLVEGNGQPPKLKWLRDQDLPPGMRSPDVILVGPITPIEPNLSLISAWFQAVQAGETRHLIVTGPALENGVKYRAVNVDTQKSLRWMIRAQSEAEALQGYG